LLPYPPSPRFGAAQKFRGERFLSLFLPARRVIENPKSKGPAVSGRAALFLRRRHDPYDLTSDFPLEIVSWFYAKLLRQDFGQGYLELTGDFAHVLTLARIRSLSRFAITQRVRTKRWFFRSNHKAIEKINGDKYS